MDIRLTFVFIISWKFTRDVNAFKAPSSLKTDVLSSHEIFVTWDEHKRHRDKNDTFYTLRYRPRNGGQTPYQYARVVKPEYLLTNAEPNTTYAFAVKFTKGKKRSRWSFTVKNTTSVSDESVVPSNQDDAVSPGPWGEWSTWSECSVTCGSGTTQRMRSRLYENGTIFNTSSSSDVCLFDSCPLIQEERNIPKPRTLQVKSLTSSIVKVKWRRPKIKKSDISVYRVLWTNVRQGQERTVNISKRFYIIDGLRPNSTYTVRVQTINTDGRASEFSKVNFTTQTELMSHSPSNITAKAIGTTKILVKWQPPIDDRDHVTGYKLQYRRKGLRRGDMCSVFTEGERLRYVITDLFKDETYKVRVGARINEKTGPYTAWQIVDLHNYKRNRKGTAEPAASNSTSLPEPDYDVGSDFEDFVPLVDFASYMPRITPLVNGVNLSWPAPNYTKVTYEFVITLDDVYEKVLEVTEEAKNFHVIRDLDPNTEYNVSFQITVMAEQRVVLQQLKQFTTLVSLNVRLVDISGEDVSSLRLECEATGITLPTIQWKKGSRVLYRNSSDVSSSNPLQSGQYVFTFEKYPPNRIVSVMTVVNVSASDQGRYRCIAADRLDRQSDSYQFIDLVDPIKKVGVSSITEFSAVVSVTPIRRFRRMSMTYILYKDLDPPRYHMDQGRTHYELDNLDPDTSYTVHVLAEGFQGARNHSETFTTLAVSLLDKEKVSVHAVNSTTLVITWKCPTQYRSHVTYRIVYTIKGNNSSNGHVMDVTDHEETATITGLLANQRYNICVEMRRKENTVSKVFVEGSTYPEAYLNADIPPTPPADVFVDFRDSMLVVSWLQPHPEYHTLVEWYEIEVFREEEVLERRRVTADVTSITINPAHGSTEYTAIVRASNRAGISDEVSRVYRPVVILPDSHELSDYSVTSLKASAISSTRILVEWSPPNTGELTRYLVRYRPNVKVGLNSSDIIDQWVTRADHRYVIANLTPNEEYAISVIPYLNDVNGNTSTVYVSTFGDIPGEPPVNVSATLVNMTSIEVTWKAPPPATWYGTLTGYMVLYRQVGHRITNKNVTASTERSYVIEGLRQGTLYEVAIAAINLNGTGRASDWIEILTEIDPSTLIVPHPPVNVSVTSHRMGLHITWSRPPDINVPVTGYVVGYGRFIPEVYRQSLDNTQTEHTITGLRQNTQYIVSVRAFNKIGESRPVFKMGRAGRQSSVSTTTTVGPADVTDVIDEPGAPSNLRVREINEEVVTLRVTWDQPSVLNGELTGYLVYYTTDPTFSPENEAFVYEEKETSTLKNLEFNTTYYFRVESQYRGVSGLSSRVVSYKTKPPDNSLHILPTPTITSVSSGADYLQVKWLPPPPQYSHVVRGYILGYGLVVANEKQDIIPVSINSYTLNNLRPSTTYHISLRMFNELGDSAQTFVTGSTLG